MLNFITIHGRITQDFELKQTPSDVPVCTFSVAVDRKYLQNGTDKVTDFFTVVCWRSLAEFCWKHLKKGSEIVVSGSMESRKYTDKNGNNRIAWELKADSVDFCGSKNETAQKPSEPKFEEVDTDEMLPF